MDEVTRRLDYVEWQMSNHADRIDDVAHATDQLEKTLSGIEANINQIKWLFAGMGLAYLLGEFGLLGTLGAII